MRAFILMCLVAAACAEYNYHPNESFGGHSGHSGHSGHVGHAGHDGNSLGGSHTGGHSHGGSSHGLAPGSDEYAKEFYSFTAPDHEFDDADANQHIANAIKKNLRVIFIKGPENKGLENAALNLAKAATGDKTAIYVLQKQSDIGSLAQKLQNIRSQNAAKPEVHFVKYRTPEDAQNAQHAIQSQYDQLPGQSHSHNGGNAPVLNFASPGTHVAAPTPKSPNNAYLPTSVFRRFRK